MTNSTKARVMMVGPSLSLRGGIVSVVEGYIAAGLDRRCGSFRYLSSVDGANPATKCLSFVKAVSRFKRLVDGCDVVHLHVSKGGSLRRKATLAKIAAAHRKRIVLHEHNGEFKRDFDAGDDRFREDVRSVFAMADRVVVLSEEWRDYFAENVCPPEKIAVLHNSVPVPAEPCSPCLHQDVLFLGRLDARKSPDVLLRASKTMLEQHPAAKLVFGGDGYPERYEALARELGIADRCEFLGWVTGEEKERLFARAGVYCLPSKNEGMPMSVLEAMAHGVPTIVTPVGGVPQVIQDGANGFLVPVDDDKKLGEVLCRLVRDASLREEIGAAGRKTILERFNVGRNVEELAMLYEGLMV